MYSAISVTLVIALAGPGLLSSATSGPSWLDWIIQFRAQLERIMKVIADVRDAIVGAATQWWREELMEVSHLLTLADLQPVVDSLMTTLQRLPADLRNELQELIDRIVAQTVPASSTGGTSETMRTAVAMDPRLRDAERRSLSRQMTTASALALATAAQRASEQIAVTLARSTATLDAGQQAAVDAETLDNSVAGAQSSRALLQYLGEGLANLMRQQATVSIIGSQQLTALSQQEALSSRNLQLILSVLATDALAQEQARRGHVAARQEALRLLAEGYSQSLLAVGSSLLELQNGTRERRRQLLDAITPTR